MITKVIYGSIRNLGDGSAGVTFFEDEECAKLDQQNAGDDGWAEECIKRLVLTSETEITVRGLVTREDVIKELEQNLKEYWYDEAEKEEFRKTIAMLKESA